MSTRRISDSHAGAIRAVAALRELSVVSLSKAELTWAVERGLKCIWELITLDVDPRHVAEITKQPTKPQPLTAYEVARLIKEQGP